MYTIGIDFGSLSARALLVSVEDGTIAARAEHPYAHGILTEDLPAGYALQDPEDYREALCVLTHRVLHESGVSPEEVIGLGLDVTSATLLPVTKDYVPLASLPAFRDHPQAMVKLWKHHAAQPQADRINETARNRGEAFLPRYGGLVSSEWTLPKLLELKETDPEVYEATGRFLEIGDWLTAILTGSSGRGACAAGYKSLWNHETGYPGKDFLDALSPGFGTEAPAKLAGPVVAEDQAVGRLTLEGALMTGLSEGTAIAAANVDAHAAVPGAGITGPDQLLIIVGTSTCAMLCAREDLPVTGICGTVKDGILPGYFGYEAGQPCVGDLLGWYVGNQVPASCFAEAASHGMDIHAWLSKKAAELAPGESGLVALDWWNGNRSILVNASLTGLILGMTLNTKPWEIYRALIESTAFGLRTIVDHLKEAGLAIEGITATGGISGKNPFLMQTYSDVLGCQITVNHNPDASGLGSAMYAAVAAGGHPGISQAAERMKVKAETVYTPDMKAHERYAPLYEIYRTLYQHFGTEHAGLMKTLGSLK